ncbi:hypothetical protein GW17_00052592 [Ensete ventricosum]|nr:hypothetical protein GW17_00052592 [Ensete ventricosum]
MHLLDCDSSPIQSPLHPSRSNNVLNLLHTSATYGRILSSPHCTLQEHSVLLGVSVDDVDDFIVNQGTKIKLLRRPKGRKNLGKGPASHERQSAPSNLSKSGEASGSGKRIRKQRLASYAARPVSFVSTGVMEVDPAKEMVTVDSSASTSHETVATSRASIGEFEVHTKGFGSRLMAKMGFVEGTGLGKEGQGMVQPIQVVKRPKSLGLGVQFEVETSSAGAEIRRIGVFERHTKGFGSKMMAKMGFVPGTGLGKDGQGIVNPLTAVKQPKSRGLACAEGGSGGSVADATDDAQLTPRYSELYRTASHGGEPDGLAHVVTSI